MVSPCRQSILDDLTLPAAAVPSATSFQFRLPVSEAISGPSLYRRLCRNCDPPDATRNCGALERTARPFRRMCAVAPGVQKIWSTRGRVIARLNFRAIRGGAIRICNQPVGNLDRAREAGTHHRLRMEAAARRAVAVGPAYPITSSARTSTDGGIVNPSALAAVLLTISSSLVGNSTGRSPGLAPLKILVT